MEAKNKQIFGWAMYDFANSSFATTILSVIYNQYFATVVAGGPKGVEIFGFRIHGASLFTFILSVSMGISAVLSPFLGAIADTYRAKKRFLMFFCYGAILFTGLLYFVGEGDYISGAIYFIFANIGFAGGNVFYNAFLPEISNEKNIGKISGFGWAMGYIGGGILLIINLFMLNYPEKIGFPKDFFKIQDCFVSVSIWWFIFSLPTFLLLKERRKHFSNTTGNYLTEGYRRLRNTLKMIKSFRELKKFLLAYLIYNEGIETIIIMASIFSADVLKMKSDEIILFFLMIQGIAIFGSLIFGLLADTIGSKNTILISLIIWSSIVLWAFRLGIIWNQNTEYWIIGILAGLVLGGSQAVSRSLQGLFTPEKISAEFFAFYAISGKFASIFGPLIYGILIALTGSVQSGILSVLLFFLIGMVILWRVDEKRGLEEKIVYCALE